MINLARGAENVLLLCLSITKTTLVRVLFIKSIGISSVNVLLICLIFPIRGV